MHLMYKPQRRTKITLVRANESSRSHTEEEHRKHTLASFKDDDDDDDDTCLVSADQWKD